MGSKGRSTCWFLFCSHWTTRFTPETGVSLDIHMVSYFTRDGHLATDCLDLAPVKSTTPLQHLDSLTQDRMQTLGAFGFSPEMRRHRVVGLIGDGILAGPYSRHHGQEFAKKAQLPRASDYPACFWESLDPLHATDKAGSHADFPEQHGRSGYIAQLHRTARKLRSLFAFGKNQAVARAAAKRLDRVETLSAFCLHLG